MDTRITKSILTIAAVAVLGIGITYAQFQSGPVTIAASSATSGTAEIQLCNADGDDTWKDTISPELSIDGLVPGGSAIELTEAANIYLGNDNGALDVPVLTGVGIGQTDECNLGSNGNSVTIQEITPHVEAVTCKNSDETINEALEDHFEISFQLDGETATEFKSLSYWKGDTSADVLLPAIAPGEAKLVTVEAQLHEDAEEQDATCTFDMVFNGNQPEEV